MPHQTPLIGSLAPDFRLDSTPDPDSGIRGVSLVDFRGKWLIVVFYPRDFSMVCPTELAALSRNIREFTDRGCSIVGISCDPVETHEHWISTPQDRGGLSGLTFPLASDPDGAVARLYGVYLELQRVALRGLFIIDPNGVLQYQVVHNLSVGRRTDDILRILDALQTGGLCAENWMSPRDTIDETTALTRDRVLSHYRIEELVGIGSFARVYRAHDMKLDRRVALKVFQHGGPMTASTVLAEARSAAALNHPNVCTIFDVDETFGIPIIAMEFIAGRPLNQILTKERISPERAAAIGHQIALGMAAAHAHGIVHGDLKPENIMITDDQMVKILDFGLSRRSGGTGQTDETIALGIAESPTAGGLFGTPSYLSPEQTRGEQASILTDIFALGLVFFEMLAGRKAIPGSGILEVLDQIRRIDADELANQVDAPFSQILRRALNIDPACRTIDMNEIAAALVSDKIAELEAHDSMI